MQVEEIQVGRTYLGKIGKPRRVLDSGAGVFQYTVDPKSRVRTTCWVNSSDLAIWAQSVIPEEVGND